MFGNPAYSLVNEHGMDIFVHIFSLDSASNLEIILLLLYFLSVQFFIFFVLVIKPDEVTPDPIPNSEVKFIRADGTAGFACGRVGSRQDKEDNRLRI